MGKSTDEGFSQNEIDSIVAQQARANRVNQVTPFGSITHTIDQGGPRNDNRVELEFSPEQQRLLEQYQLAQLMAGQTAVAGFGDLAGGRAAVEQAQFDRALGLLAPVHARQEEALRQRLANQGLPQSSQGFNAEVGRFETSRDQALEQLALASVVAGGAEQSRLSQMILSLLGGAQPSGVPVISVPEVTVPVNQPQGGGLGVGRGALAGALSGAGTGAAFGPWGALAGAAGGGLLGAFAGS